MKSISKALYGLILAAGVAAAAPPTDEQLAELYAQPSPFESVPQDQWIAESDNAYVIRDHKPQAPVHLLVISKKRVPTLLQASPDLLGEMLDLARKAAEQEGIARDGFRIVINTHPRGSQSVYHLHLHVLGGRQMTWPPG
jgi:histidine triad (HIT) family protein